MVGKMAALEVGMVVAANTLLLKNWMEIIVSRETRLRL